MPSTAQHDLTRRLDRVAIEALKYSYAHWCDRDYAPDELAHLFLQNATWDGDIFGVHEGRVAIRAFFEEAGRQVSFATHYLLNPEIELNGDMAVGKWMLWQQLVLRETGQAFWLMGRYTDTYARVADQWKIASLKLKILSFTPYEEGPGKTLIATIAA
ncbi:hypothetical protein CAF53_03370 [Sphingobium sp. LB126]|uniref:nuclear transport factor 2 family protein n=1 Tax=Sphingobium sp. LB126 TaxID=1983755 RepID=UPI000C2030AD|nr:nuclear transport factor 2 family protein [Sphingobium sp. LB126]PJG47386.1 hypothetical protein CAF53_03370 [Sphingobium sp. LB126]